jgi:hypothetical protein
MKLQIEDIWSPDLNPPSTGRPADNRDFDVFVQVALGVAGQLGREVFSVRVCSSSALARTKSGTFVSNTLVLEQFAWATVRGRLAKLIAQCDGCQGWDEAIQRLSGCLRYGDAV